MESGPAIFARHGVPRCSGPACWCGPPPGCGTAPLVAHGADPAARSCSRRRSAPCCSPSACGASAASEQPVLGAAPSRRPPLRRCGSRSRDRAGNRPGRLAGTWPSAPRGDSGRQECQKSGYRSSGRCGLLPFDTGAGCTVTLRSDSSATAVAQCPRCARKPTSRGTHHVARATERRPERRANVVPDQRDRAGRPPTRHRRVACQGEDDQGLPRPRLRRRGERRAHPRPSERGAEVPRSTPARCAASAWTSSTTSSRSTSSTPTRRPRSASSRSSWPPPTSFTSPPMRTARARPSPGTSCRSHQAQGPGPPDGLPRDHQGRHPRGRGQPARAEQAHGRRPGDPPHPRPPLRLRVSPVLWKKVMPRLSAAASSPWPPGSSSSGSAERIAFRSAEYWDLTGTFGTGRTGDTSDPAAFAARLTAVDGRRIAQGRDFGPDGRLKGAQVLHLDEANARALAAALADTAFSVRSVESSRTAARRTRRSGPRPSSGRPAGSSASAPRRRCRSRRSCTRTASSPTCVRTPRRCPTRPSPRPCAGHAAVRRRLPARRAPHVRGQGQERAGGARGDPPLG